MNKLISCISLFTTICTCTLPYSAPASSNSLKLDVNGLTITDHWRESRLEYGMVNTADQVKEIGSISMDSNKDIVQEITTYSEKK